MNIELHRVPIVFFEEGEIIIAHCVPLDVSSCGHDMEEAKRNIRDAIEGYIEACEEMGTLEEVLEESGFVKQGDNWVPPVLLSMDSLDISASTI